VTKRAHHKFRRNERDFYATPESAVLPLLPHLTSMAFNEPCAGDGALIWTMCRRGGTCFGATDIAPRHELVNQADAFSITECIGGTFVTNPPWSRPVLHKLIVHLSDIAPTWLLFDADWMHTKQSIPYMRQCRKIVSVGRVSWMGNGVSGFDNCAWYLFDAAQGAVEKTQFIGRGK